MKSGYKKIALRIQLISIPICTLLGGIFLSDNLSTFGQFAWKLLDSFVAISLTWLFVKFLVYQLRKWLPKRSQMGKRLAFQFKLSLIFALLLYALIGLPHNIFEQPELSYWECLIDLRKIALVLIIFGAAINLVYESLYLFERLTETEVEAERYKKATVEAQFQSLKNQVNPHFLFNSLNTLSTIIEEDSGKAVDFVQELSQVYRYVLNNQNNDWVSLKEELDFTWSYVFLLQMRHEDNLTINIDVAKQYHQLYLPPVTLQLLLENAIKHNEISSEHPLHIDIYTENDWLVIKNRKRKRNALPNSNGIGLKNIEQRYQILDNKQMIVEDTAALFMVKLPLIQFRNA